jgi:hypothetical protein
MRIASMPVVIVWLVFSGSALAQAEDQTEAQTAKTAVRALEREDLQRAIAASTTTLPADRKMEAGLSFLSMPIGKGNGYLDLAFSYGVGLSFSRTVWRGLTLGVAPQVLFNIKRNAKAPASTEYDFMVRLAYVFRVTSKLSGYTEMLPGYSLLSHPTGDQARGFVIAYGLGGKMDLTNQLFANLGVGYQNGIQTLSVDGTSYWHRTQFWRLDLGTGWRF